MDPAGGGMCCVAPAGCLACDARPLWRFAHACADRQHIPVQPDCSTAMTRSTHRSSGRSMRSARAVCVHGSRVAACAPPLHSLHVMWRDPGAPHVAHAVAPPCIWPHARRRCPPYCPASRGGMAREGARPALHCSSRARLPPSFPHPPHTSRICPQRPCVCAADRRTGDCPGLPGNVLPRVQEVGSCRPYSTARACHMSAHCSVYSRALRWRGSRAAMLARRGQAGALAFCGGKQAVQQHGPCPAFIVPVRAHLRVCAWPAPHLGAPYMPLHEW